MKKSISRIIGLIMLIIAIVFIMFALNHPEKSFPWNNTITWLLYGVYFLVTVVLLIAPKMKREKVMEKRMKKHVVRKNSKFQKVQHSIKSFLLSRLSNGRSAYEKIRCL